MGIFSFGRKKNENRSNGQDSNENLSPQQTINSSTQYPPPNSVYGPLPLTDAVKAQLLKDATQQSDNGSRTGETIYGSMPTEAQILAEQASKGKNAFMEGHRQAGHQQPHCSFVSELQSEFAKRGITEEKGFGQNR